MRQAARTWSIAIMTHRIARGFRNTAQPDDSLQQSLLDAARGGSDASHERLLMAQADWMKPWFERELPACLAGQGRRR